MLQYEATPVPAPAEENTLETRTPGADPSVPSTLTVSEHWPARGTNVSTPALAPVDTMLSAELSTTTPPVHACQTMSGTHSEGAVSNVSTACFYFTILGFWPVDQEFIRNYFSRASYH